MKHLPLWAIGAVAGLAVAGGGLMLWNAQRGKAVTYLSAPVDRGSIRRTITASGSVNPEITVQVGAFVSGTIKSLACDYNTPVHKAQVCATIDPRPYQLAADQARAALGIAQAQMVKDQASLTYANLANDRSAKLSAQGWVARDAADSTLSLRNQALGQIALDRATIQQRQAALKAAEVNLGYTAIVSPVDGVVVSRNVTVGQTVASSFQTPTLFLIAKDLARMQVDTNVSESDIAGAALGARATFTVEAYPGRAFHGRVVQVRQAPISVQNVITYDVVIAAENPDLLLKPGMTATTKIVSAERRNVLRAPVQALTFSPTAALATRPGTRKTRAQAKGQQVWVLEDGKPKAVPVTTGLDDDSNVEITGGGLKAGDRVILSASHPGRAAKRRTAAAGPGRFGP